MKKILSIMLIIIISAALLSACNRDPGETVDTTTPPGVSLEPLVTTGNPAATTPGETAASPGTTSTPDGTAEPGQTPGTSGQPSIPPASTYAPLDPGYAIAQTLAGMYKNCAYAILCTVEEDLGARNIMKGTSLGDSLPNAILDYWEYKVTVKEVFKSASAAQIKADTTVTISLPYEIKLKSSEKLAREQPFVQLEKGESYVLLLDYEDYYKVYMPSTTEPNKLKVDGDDLRYVTGVTDYYNVWKMVYGTDTIKMSTFRDLTK